MISSKLPNNLTDRNPRRRFPYPLPQGIDKPWKVPLWYSSINAAKYVISILTPRDKVHNISLEPVLKSRIRSLSNDDMPLIFIVHNDEKLILSFLSHYRSVGVTRFICVDDQSSDHSRQILLQQPDVDLFGSNVRYRDAGNGKRWREMLFARYGFNRWYLNLDSDEYLFYGTSDKETILEYARRLEAVNIKRLPAPMIDCYPAGPVDSAHFSGDEGLMPWDVATHYDAEGYVGDIGGRNVGIRGGVRNRAFGDDIELMKYPLIYWDKKCFLGRTIHRPRPYIFNFPPVLGCLLHFKIFSDFRSKVLYAVKEAQHHEFSRHYKVIFDQLDPDNDLNFVYENSIKFIGEKDLVKRGFILPLS